jgi:hypothetical protein
MKRIVVMVLLAGSKPSVAGGSPNVAGAASLDGNPTVGTQLEWAAAR